MCVEDPFSQIRSHLLARKMLSNISCWDIGKMSYRCNTNPNTHVSSCIMLIFYKNVMTCEFINLQGQSNQQDSNKPNTLQVILVNKPIGERQ